MVGLFGFGGVTSSLPSNPLAHGIFSWMKSNFAKLPEFVSKAVDFGVLSSATNLSKILVKSGCTHVECLREKEFESSAELGESSKSVSKSVRNFMSSFWLKFGRADARSLMEARHAVGHYMLPVLVLSYCCLWVLLIFLPYAHDFHIMQVGLEEGRGPMCRCGGSGFDTIGDGR